MIFCGHCHCGAVAFEVEAPKPFVAQDCNCSICTMTGYIHLIVPKSRFRLLTPEENAGTYRFNTMKIGHRFCPVCGIQPYADGQDKEGNQMAAINVRCLDDVDLSALRVIQYDGLHH